MESSPGWFRPTFAASYKDMDPTPEPYHITSPQRKQHMRLFGNIGRIADLTVKELLHS